MKYVYRTVTDRNEIEVDDDWGGVLIELDRLEYNANQTETRRHASLEAFNLDDALLPADIDIPAEFEITEQVTEVFEAIVKLPVSQRELISAVIAGMTLAEYSRRKGVSKSAVSQQFERARKKIKNSFL